MRPRVLTAVVVVVLLVASCGGDDDDVVDDGPEPDTATAGTSLLPESAAEQASFPGFVNDGHGSRHCFYDDHDVLLDVIDSTPEEVVARVNELFGDDTLTRPEDGDTQIGEITRWETADDPLTLADQITSLDLARAAPNFAYGFSPEWKFSPGHAPADATDPGRSLGFEGGVVVVLDTGFDAGAWPFGGSPPVVLGSREALELESGPVAGHGTFVAGVIAQFAIEATIRVTAPVLVGTVVDDLVTVPATTDWEVSRVLEEITATDIDVLNMSLGSYACTDVPTQGDGVREPMNTRSELERLLATNGGMVVTAAAGNDGHGNHGVDDTPGVRFFPAAWAVEEGFVDRVISVGTSEPDADSNYADWVITSATGRLVSYRPAQHDNPPYARPAGWYEWSGTSFAAACLAARIVEEDGTGAEGWSNLKDDATTGAGVFADAAIGEDHFSCPPEEE